jgi:hypothetical protein
LYLLNIPIPYDLKEIQIYSVNVLLSKKKTREKPPTAGINITAFSQARDPATGSEPV